MLRGKVSVGPCRLLVAGGRGHRIAHPRSTARSACGGVRMGRLKGSTQLLSLTTCPFADDLDPPLLVALGLLQLTFVAVGRVVRAADRGHHRRARGLLADAHPLGGVRGALLAHGPESAQDPSAHFGCKEKENVKVTRAGRSYREGKCVRILDLILNGNILISAPKVSIFIWHKPLRNSTHLIRGTECIF